MPTQVRHDRPVGAALSSLASGAATRLIITLMVLNIGSAAAAPLDPYAFASLGSLNVTSGTLTINTDTLAISGGASFTGVTYAQSSTLDPEVAVFTFDSIEVGDSVSVSVNGSRPLALLSQRDVTIGTTINLSGGSGGAPSGTTGGVGGAAGAAAGRPGGDGGSASSSGQAGEGAGGGKGGSATTGSSGGGGSGAGFGGHGGSGYQGTPAGGSPYGNLMLRLEGGSGGGGGGGIGGITPRGGNGGGGGAGAIEIGAAGNVALASIIAVGGSGVGNSGARSGGGGSGGGVLVHGRTVAVTGSLAAHGGFGNFSQYGAGGAGGRIAILGLPSYTIGAPLEGISVNLNGGSGINHGDVGVLTLGPVVTTIPNGTSVLLDGTAILIDPASTGQFGPSTEVLIQRNLIIQSDGYAALGGSDMLSFDAELAVEGAGIFDVSAFQQSVSALSGDGEVRIGSDGSLTVGSGDATSTFGGRISGGGDFRKTGAGTLTLLGANSYSGTTYLDEGTLALSNSLSTTGGPIEIGLNATLQASGIIQRSPIGTGSIAATGTLLMGDLSKSSGYAFGGSLEVGSHTVQLLDADAAHLGSQTTLAAGGRLASLNGIELNAGANLTAADAAEVDGAFTNNGTVDGPTAAGQFLTFTDDVDGAGNYTGNILFSDGFSPGSSPAAVSLQNVDFDSTAALRLEIGGPTAGTEHDQLIVSGMANLSGTLEIVLIDGFEPSAGDRFELLNWGASSGAFDTLLLPALGGSLTWNTSQLYPGGVLSVGLPGDYNFDGMVDAADYVLWRKSNGTPDGYDTWRSHFGQTAVSGSVSTATVPEPLAVLLLIFAAAVGMCTRYRRSS